jgi:hypothetical protein
MQIFKKYKIIPKFCFDCYKVVVEPRTVIEQFKLLMIFERITLPLDNWRKCMVECRVSCSGAYKGLVYCQGIEDGKEILKMVRDAVSEDISPMVNVTLKRGCSEYAEIYPEYSKPKSAEERMQYNKDWQSLEDTFDKEHTFHLVPGTANEIYDNGYTPLEVFGLKCWLRYAATIGDMSYLAISGTTLPPMPHIKRPPWAPKT